MPKTHWEQLDNSFQGILNQLKNHLPGEKRSRSATEENK